MYRTSIWSQPIPCSIQACLPTPLTAYPEPVVTVFLLACFPQIPWRRTDTNKTGSAGRCDGGAREARRQPRGDAHAARLLAVLGAGSCTGWGWIGIDWRRHGSWAMHGLPARRFHGVVVPPLDRLHLTDQDPLPNCCLRRSMSILGVILLGSHRPFLNISTVEPLPCFLD